VNGRALFRALLVGLLVFSAFAAAWAQTARVGTTASVSIEESAGARVATYLLTQTAVLTVATAPGAVSSISVPGSVDVRNGQDGNVTLPATAALLDSAGGLAPAGLSISISGAAGQGAGRAGDGPMQILVQYN
jgi:hypothetical protein